MIKRKKAKVEYSIDAHKSETKEAEITVKFDVAKSRVTFLEKGRPLFSVSACDAESMAKKFREINKACENDVTRVTLNASIHSAFTRSIIS